MKETKGERALGRRQEADGREWALFSHRCFAGFQRLSLHLPRASINHRVEIAFLLLELERKLLLHRKRSTLWRRWRARCWRLRLRAAGPAATTATTVTVVH